MTDDINRLAAMLTRAFREGFNFTREGWNGECAFEHLAPDGLTLEEKSAITVSAILADHDAKPAASGNAVTLTDAERDEIERLQRSATDWRLEAEVHRKRAAAAVAEIARLRLTDAEREAIEWCLSLPMLDRDVVRMMPLRSLLERLTRLA